MGLLTGTTDKRIYNIDWVLELAQDVQNWCTHVYEKNGSEATILRVKIRSDTYIYFIVTVQLLVNHNCQISIYELSENFDKKLMT